jgi:hypothetical protein
MKKWFYTVVATLLAIAFVISVVFIGIILKHDYDRADDVDKVSWEVVGMFFFLVVLPLAGSILLFGLGLGKINPNKLIKISFVFACLGVLSFIVMVVALLDIIDVGNISFGIFISGLILQSIGWILMMIGTAISRPNQQGELIGGEVNLPVTVSRAKWWFFGISIFSIVLMLAVGGVVISSLNSHANTVDEMNDYIANNETDESKCSMASSLPGRRTNSYSNKCYKRIAIEKKDCTICEGIQSDSRGYSEKPNCYRDCAKATKNVEWCVKSSNEGRTGSCWISVMIEIENVSFCQELKQEGHYGADNCFEGIAKKLENASLCDEISRNSSRDYCYEQIAIDTLNVESCREIKDLNMGDRCFSGIAERTNNSLLCEEINEQDDKFSCKARIGGMWELCSNIADSQKKKHCFLNKAFYTKDPSVCKDVYGEDEQDRLDVCMEAASE